MFQQRKMRKKAVQTEAEWDRLRQGRGPNIMELADLAARFGLTSGDAGIIGVMALRCYQDSEGNPSPLSVVSRIEQETAEGITETIGGRPLNQFVSPAHVSTFAALVIRFVHDETAPVLVPFLQDRGRSLGLT